MKVLYISLIGIVMLLLAGFISRPVQAHVLIVDDSKTKGAILHINPNDSPVAGETAALIFDTENNVIHKNSQVTLRIKDQTGSTKQINMTVDKTMAVAEYTFPSQGVYDLSFSIKADNAEAITFHYTQRVSRGTANRDVDQPNYEWAKILLLGSGLSIVVLAIVAFNNRHHIRRDSTF